MKKLILLFLTLSQVAFARDGGQIKGIFLDDQNNPLSFTTVLLLNARDSSVVKADLANDDGRFTFEDLKTGVYLISTSMVGYESFTSTELIITNENQIIDLKEIKIKPISSVLKEVQIKGSRPLLVQKADKLVMNLEGSISNAGSTILETLRRAPGVSLDQNENISLKGKQGVQIYIDGKPTYMSQDQLLTLLKTMSSEEVDHLEIITNPSSKYDAAGNSGIINIVRKKNENFGTNGSLTVMTGGSILPEETQEFISGALPKFNLGLQLNNRQGKYNTFGNLSIRQNQNFQIQEFSRSINQKTIDQISSNKNEVAALNARLGSDYFITENTTFGIMVNANFGTWQPVTSIENNSSIFNAEVLESIMNTTSNTKQTWKNLSFNTNFKHRFGKQEFSADLDYSVYNNLSREKGMETTFFNAIGEPVGDILTVTSNIPNLYNILAAKTDYSLALNEKSKLEAGAKASFVKSDNDIRFFNNMALDLGRSNHYIYSEGIQALYTNYSRTLNEKWNLQAGLRLENTQSKGFSKTYDETRQRNELKLFPSLFISHIMNENHTLNLNYSKRIDRPDYQTLNPFVYFLDPYTYQLGNEKLRPQLTDALGLSYTYKNAYVTSIEYSNTKNFFTQILKNALNEPEVLELLIKYNPSAQIDPHNITFAILENVGTKQSLSISTGLPVKVNKWWSMNNNLTGFLNHYKGLVMGESMDIKSPGFNLYTGQNFSLPKGWKAEVSAWFNSNITEATVSGRAMYAVNTGLSKSFLDQKGSLKITVNDLFATAKFRGNTDFAGVKMSINNRWDSRGIRATLSYRFGNQNVKQARNRATANSDEQSRLGEK